MLTRFETLELLPLFLIIYPGYALIRKKQTIRDLLKQVGVFTGTLLLSLLMLLWIMGAGEYMKNHYFSRLQFHLELRLDKADTGRKS